MVYLHRMNTGDGDHIRHSRVLIVILLLVLAVIIVRTAWVCDDAYISFRTVDNFVNGYGLTWNTDERVQGFTHPLWVLTMSGFYMITGEIYYTSIFVSLALTLLALLLVSTRIARSSAGAVLALLAALLSKAFIDYSTSGLENALNYLILVSFLLVYLKRKASHETFFTLCAVAGLGVLNRMDTVLLYLPVLVAMFIRLRSWRTLRLGLAGFTPFILWELFSVVYYGFPFPNTYYAKMHTGIPLSDLLEQGFIYYLDSLDIDPLTLVVVAAGILLTFTVRKRRHILIVAGILLYLAYTVKIGGDFMSGRFFTLPFLASIVLISTYPFPKTWAGRLIPIAIVAALGLLSPRSPVYSNKTYGTHGEGGINEKGIADERAWYYQKTGFLRKKRGTPMPDHEWAREGREHRQIGDSLIYEGCVGFMGFYAGPDVHIYDGFSLNEPLLARLPIQNLRDWRIGHFRRTPPAHYRETLSEGENHIAYPELAAFYDTLTMITRGRILDWNRLAAVWKMNTGGYDSLLRVYTHPPQLSSTYAEISVLKEGGTLWNADGNFIIRRSGISVGLDSLRYGKRFEISVDHNDFYAVIFFKGSEEIGETKVERRHPPGGGLRIDTLDIPSLVQEAGFDAFIIIPEGGDDLYSVGHFRLLEE